MQNLNNPILASLSNLRNHNSEGKNKNKQNVQDPEAILFSRRKVSFDQDQTNCIQQFNSQKPFIFDSVNNHNLHDYMQQLYESTSYKNYQLYKCNISSLRTDLYGNDKKRVHLLWGILRLLDWQSVSMRDICEYIYRFPSKQEEVERIRLENGQLKFDKLGLNLIVNLTTGQYQLGPISTCLNRFQGRYYTRSISKINHQVQSYQFGETILQIQSNQLLIAVRTAHYVFVINPDHRLSQFKIMAKDICVFRNRVYYTLLDGQIGSIFMQTTYLPLLNKVAEDQSIVNDCIRKGQFLVSSADSIIVVGIDLQKKQIKLRKLEGNVFLKQKLNITLALDESIVQKKALYQQGYFHVLIITGIGKNIKKLYQYKFKEA